MLRGVKAGLDGADHLAIDDNWKRALHLGEAAVTAATPPWLIASSSA
jgi:hypothetical protein